MGKSINKVILVGRLGKDPELKYTASGTPFCRFSMATDDSWTDKGSGQKTERTEWHNVVVWNKLAEICNQYLSKGRMVYVEGKLQTREWDDKEGVKRKTTEIVIHDMMMLGDKGGSSGGGGGQQTASRTPGTWGDAPSGGAGQGGDVITDDDIPFRSNTVLIDRPAGYHAWHENENMPGVRRDTFGRGVLRTLRNGRR